MLNIHAVGTSAIARRERLQRMLDTPYLGRIDFNGEPVYIGVHTFHDFELGQATYTSPSGEVAGGITLKRQYRIKNGRMEYMFESSVTVHDDVLQRELSANADDKMRNIVATRAMHRLTLTYSGRYLELAEK